MSNTNPFGDADDKEDVLEGFLCPICKEDLKAPERLTAHFENSHSEDQDLIKSFKDMFMTAKKKIKYFDDNVLSSASGETALRSTFSSPRKLNVPPPKYPQDIGADRDHTEFFKAIR